MKWLRSSLFKNNSDTFVFEENINVKINPNTNASAYNTKAPTITSFGLKFPFTIEPEIPSESTLSNPCL